ncbi:hypothetical protein EMIT0347P_20551 [Pseudomonas sp. IT-347P]
MKAILNVFSWRDIYIGHNSAGIVDIDSSKGFRNVGLSIVHVIQGQTTFRQNKTWSGSRLQLYYFSW